MLRRHDLCPRGIMRIPDLSTPPAGPQYGIASRPGDPWTRTLHAGCRLEMKIQNLSYLPGPIQSVIARGNGASIRGARRTIGG